MVVIIGDLLPQPHVEVYTVDRSVMDSRMSSAPPQICCRRGPATIAVPGAKRAELYIKH